MKQITFVLVITLIGYSVFNHFRSLGMVGPEYRMPSVKSDVEGLASQVESLQAKLMELELQVKEMKESKSGESDRGSLIEEIIVRPGQNYEVEDYGNLGKSDGSSLVCKYLFRGSERTRVYWYSPNDIMGKSYCPSQFSDE